MSQRCVSGEWSNRIIRHFFEGHTVYELSRESHEKLECLKSEQQWNDFQVFKYIVRSLQHETNSHRTLA